MSSPEDETEDLLECLVREPDGDAGAAVIWLHGLGATNRDFAGVPPELGLPDDLRVRFVFPQAPRRSVTVNHGMVMPAWYDIRSLDERGHDEEGIRRSEAQLRRLVEAEVEKGVAESRIVVAGFSQGGAIALQTGLRHGESLAGIMVLSAYLLLPEKTADERHPANTGTPIFMAHGTQDPMVPFPKARESKDLLKRMGYDVEWHEYPMGHQVCLEEIRAIGRWLEKVLG